MAALGDVCDVVGGGTPAKDQAEFYVGSIPWATVRDMRSELLSSTEFKITQLAVERSSTNIIPKGNVVIATRVGLGKVCLLQQDTAINQDLRAIIPKNGKQLGVNFLFWWLKSVAHLVVAEGTGATVQGVKLPFIKSLLVPLPPLSEQQRIVTVLDEAFAGLANAAANAEKNIKNARELFENYLNAAFGRKGSGEQLLPLEKLCELDRIITYGVIKLGNENPNGVPCLRTSNVRWLNIDLSGLKRISSKLSEQYSRTILRGGEVLVNVRGTLGGVAVAAKEMKGWNVSREVAVVPTDTSQILPEFLAYFIGTRDSQNWLIGVQKGVAYTGINIADLRTLPVSLPKMSEQKQVVDKLEEVSAESRRLEEHYRRKVLRLSELKQSLLRAAFSGELTSPPTQVIKEAAE